MKKNRINPDGMFLAGLGPFITFRRYKLAGRLIIWKAREHRKGLMRAARAVDHLPVRLWQTRSYNQWMGATFALGSFLFMMGSLLTLLPHPSWVLKDWANHIFFWGSIPFTLAAYMQHFQAANATHFSLTPCDHVSLAPISFLGWQPHELGWLSTLAQLVGTLAFNISTFAAINNTVPWNLVDRTVWIPDMLGSALFLVSAYLAFIEVNPRFWKWRPTDLAWRIVFVNLVGCIAFMVSACTSYVPSHGQIPWVALFSNVQLLLGAVCFLIGALLTIRESRSAG